MGVKMFNYLRSLSLQMNKEPSNFSMKKLSLFFLLSKECFDCRYVNMGGWASLFSGLSRRIPESVTQRAVAAYFTGETGSFRLKGFSRLKV